MSEHNGTSRTDTRLTKKPRRPLDAIRPMPIELQKEEGRKPSANTIILGAKASVIMCYRDCGSIRKAAIAAGISRRQVYDWISEDPDFKAAMMGSRAMIVGLLEDESFRRAVEGVPRLKFHDGKPIMVPDPDGAMMEDPDGATNKDGTPKMVPEMVPYVEYVYSDEHLEILLKANCPEKYRDRVEHAHTGEVGLKLYGKEASTDAV